MTLVLVGVLAGCVTEKSNPSRGVAVPATGPRPSAGQGQRTLELPNGPIAQPADPSSTLTAHVQVAIKPLGGIDYDGLTLPVVSPDARFLATQSGDAPTWETVLAEPGAASPISSAITAYELAEGALKRIDWPEPPPAGLLLGRSADDRGVLVESARPDGARWIGRLDWLSGRVQWLVQGDAVNAHAVLTPRGELLFTRRPIESKSAVLVLRDVQGRETVKAPVEGAGADSARYWFPAATSDDAYVYAVMQSSANAPLELQAIRVSRGSGSGGAGSGGGEAPPKLGSVVARRRVADPGDGVLAYQMMSATLPAHPRIRAAGEDDSTPRPGSRLLFFHPALQRACIFDVDGGVWRALAPQSIAAAPGVGVDGPTKANTLERGYFAATPEGIVYSLPNTNAVATDGDYSKVKPEKAARIINGNFVPRGYTAGDSTVPAALTLIGQVPGRPDRLDVFRLYVGYNEASEKLPAKNAPAK